MFVTQLCFFVSLHLDVFDSRGCCYRARMTAEAFWREVSNDKRMLPRVLCDAIWTSRAGNGWHLGPPWGLEYKTATA